MSQSLTKKINLSSNNKISNYHILEQSLDQYIEHENIKQKRKHRKKYFDNYANKKRYNNKFDSRSRSRSRSKRRDRSRSNSLWKRDYSQNLKYKKDKNANQYSNSETIQEKIENLMENFPRFVVDDFPRKTYEIRQWERKKDIRHWGQRKLMLSEIYFLTKFGHLSDFVVYAGAAPGSHIKYLAKMFPNHEFLLIDPSKFFIEEEDKLKIVNEYFTLDLAKKIQEEKSCNYLFISDIRTADIYTMQPEEHEQYVMKDNQLQIECVNIMKPKKSMLKFRCPYPDKCNLDKTTFFKGEIFIQPWAPHSSTETRLIPDDDLTLCDYDNKIYEENLFYHNDVTRLEKKYEQIIQAEGYDDSYDTQAEIIILYEYIQKNQDFIKARSLGSKIKILSERITKYMGSHRNLSSKNKPRDQRRKFEIFSDHKNRYNDIKQQNLNNDDNDSVQKINNSNSQE